MYPVDVIHRDWHDFEWKSVLEAQDGLDTPTRRQRSALFGPNLVDIQSKSTVSLLLDEVGFLLFEDICIVTQPIDTDYTSLLCISNCEYYSMVYGQLLLLCILHRPYIHH